MFTFTIVKKIHNAKSIDKNSFILERLRRERVLGLHRTKSSSDRLKKGIFIRDEKFPPS